MRIITRPLISFNLAFRQILAALCPYPEAVSFLLGFCRTVLSESDLRILGFAYNARSKARVHRVRHGGVTRSVGNDDDY